ncbi:hypothetical protein ACQ4N7_24085 [Nodosilinea sp. AN01ver1]|uniref:hypothetical protein n=1 Tax=Nodosilinea sp. AN01ver1 TaxID=3423362 RepID=UPI003D30F6A1
MSDQNRFANLLKVAQQKPAEAENFETSTTAPNAQTPEHLDIQASNQPGVSASKAKSSSKDFKRTTVYLTQDLHRRLKRASLDEEMEMSDIAEAAIAAWLDEHSDA